jgi:hypothetical protein
MNSVGISFDPRIQFMDKATLGNAAILGIMCASRPQSFVELFSELLLNQKIGEIDDQRASSILIFVYVSIDLQIFRFNW